MKRIIFMMIMPMLALLLVVIPVTYILFKEQKKKQLKEDGQNQHHLKKASLIKFDRRQIKQSAICTIIFLVLAVSSTVVAHFGMVDVLSDFWMVVFLVVYVCSGPALFYSAYQLLSGGCYLRRLKKHGYEIPENKKDYDSLLEILPRRQQTDKDTIVKKPYNRASLALGVCSLIALLVLCAINIWFLLEWYFMYKGEIAFVIGLMSVADVVLLGYCICVFRQMNEQRYRDDVELDSTRKKRMPLVEGVFTILILVGISVFVKYMAYSATDYMFQSRVSSDIATVQSVQQSLMNAYETMEVCENHAEWKATKNELVNGVDITTWGVPQDDFQKEVAQIMGISDFGELRDDFHTSVGDAVVYVKLENEHFVVELGNPPEKVRELDSVIRAE